MAPKPVPGWKRFITWARIKLGVFKPFLAERFGLFVVPSFYGPKLVSNRVDQTFKFYQRGSYGTFYWDRIVAFDTPFVFLDIGANQGLYSIAAAQNAQCSGCYAFEPVPSSFRFLKANIALNGLKDRVALIRKAISDRQGLADIAIVPDHSGAASIAHAQGQRGVATGKTTQIDRIDASDLDRLLPSEGPPIAAKVDVEGHEPEVLGQLLSSGFAERIREIYFEVDEDWYDIDPVKRTLRANGFTRLARNGEGRHYDILATREQN